MRIVESVNTISESRRFPPGGCTIAEQICTGQPNGWPAVAESFFEKLTFELRKWHEMARKRLPAGTIIRVVSESLAEAPRSLGSESHVSGFPSLLEGNWVKQTGACHRSDYRGSRV